MSTFPKVISTTHTPESLDLYMRECCQPDWLPWDCVIPVIKPALEQFMIGRGQSGAGIWRRDFLAFYDEVYNKSGFPYQIQFTTT